MKTKLIPYTCPEEKHSSMVGHREPSKGVILPDNERFRALLIDSGFKVSENGIYQEYKTGTVNISNFSNIRYLFNKLQGNKKFRFIKINDSIFRITPEHLVNPLEFRKLLLSANYNLSCSKHQFNKLVNIIVKMDNNKIITDTTGYGKVADRIYNFGNKILVNNELIDFQPVVWLGKRGYSLNKTDMLQVSAKSLNLSQVWKTFYNLYGMQAVLIIGYAVANLFFQEYMEIEKCFPLLYIKAGSGRGKNGLAELIENLYGIKHPFANVNCAGNSTKIGIENKSILLNNLPLILNELTEKEFEFIKSRYDGQGSVKYSDYKPGNISERSVNGPTIITTVVNPHDKQIISRCIFINLDITKLQKAKFEQARKLSKSLSIFGISILRNISIKDILIKIAQFKESLNYNQGLPRIIDNYSLVAGCFLAFCSLIADKTDLPDPNKLKKFIVNEIKQTGNYLNPLNYFLRELERLSECKVSHKYITEDEDYLYFNFNGVWSLISQSYKNKYLPFITSSNIKALLKNSRFIAHYGNDFEANSNNSAGKPVCTFFKKFANVSRRCFVLVKSEMPWYYK